MTMRYTWIPFLMTLLCGCATQDSVEVYIPTPSQSLVRAAPEPTKLVETRYELRSYREAANQAIRHETHAVYRRTRVPGTISTDIAIGSRTNHPPASFAPLAESDELAAELGTQKKITADLHAMQTSMRETEQRMQAQYATLVRQSAEVVKVREALDAERARLRTAPAATPAATSPARSVRPPTADSSQVKW
jgi:hypothetical protein